MTYFWQNLTRALRKNGDPRVKITYEIITPESAEEGDVAESGWEDDEGVSMTLDEWDIEEETTLAEKTAKWLYDEGAIEPSSSHFYPGTWYTAYGDQDYRTGAYKNRSFHLHDFTPDEERQVWDELNKLTRRR